MRNKSASANSYRLVLVSLFCLVRVQNFNLNMALYDSHDFDPVAAKVKFVSIERSDFSGDEVC